MGGTLWAASAGSGQVRCSNGFNSRVATNKLFYVWPTVIARQLSDMEVLFQTLGDATRLRILGLVRS